MGGGVGQLASTSPVGLPAVPRIGEAKWRGARHPARGGVGQLASSRPGRLACHPKDRAGDVAGAQRVDCTASL